MLGDFLFEVFRLWQAWILMASEARSSRFSRELLSVILLFHKEVILSCSLFFLHFNLLPDGCPLHLKS